MQTRSVNRPVFEYVPALGDNQKCLLKVLALEGISTLHSSRQTDRGRLYATVQKAGEAWNVFIFNSARREDEAKVAAGSAASLKTYFDLEEANDSGITGRAWLDSYSANDFGIVLFPTFAIDRDVISDFGAAQKFPGWDSVYGFGHLHAAAMREIITDALPAAVPFLFAGTGMASFVPQGETLVMPDLSRIANADQLRIAQGNLVKALSCQQKEHLDDFMKQGMAARTRFEDAMDRLTAANTKNVEVGASRPEVTQGVLDTFNRV